VGWVRRSSASGALDRDAFGEHARLGHGAQVQHVRIGGRARVRTAIASMRKNCARTRFWWGLPFMKRMMTSGP